MKVIVSNTRGYYESIHTEDTLCMLFIKIKYLYKGYRVYDPIPFWLAKRLYKWFGWRTLRGVNVSFEKFVPGTDQCTWWQPWMNFQ